MLRSSIMWKNIFKFKAVFSDLAGADTQNPDSDAAKESSVGFDSD